MSLIGPIPALIPRSTPSLRYQATSRRSVDFLCCHESYPCHAAEIDDQVTDDGRPLNKYELVADKLGGGVIRRQLPTWCIEQRDT